MSPFSFFTSFIFILSARDGEGREGERKEGGRESILEHSFSSKTITYTYGREVGEMKGKEQAKEEDGLRNENQDLHYLYVRMLPLDLCLTVFQ